MVANELNAFANAAEGVTLIQKGDEYTMVLPLEASKEGISPMMNFLTALTTKSAYSTAKLDVNGDGVYTEDEIFFLNSIEAGTKLYMQTLIDAIVNSGMSSDELAARITDKTDLSSKLGYYHNLGVEVVGVPMILEGGSYPAEVMLYVTLEEVSDQIYSAIKGYNAISDYVKATMDNGEVRLTVTMPENYPIYEAYMALMMMEEATYTDSVTGETVTASWDNIDKMNGAMAFHYLIEDVIGSIVNDENVTIDTYDNTIDILNQIAGKVTDKQLPNIPESIYAMGKEYSVEQMYEKFASLYGRMNLVYDGENDEVYKSTIVPIQQLVDKMNLGTLTGMIAEYKTGVQIKVTAEITDAKPDYQALVVDLRADGITSKVYMTEDVVASAANMSGAGAIMLLTDIDTLVLDTKAVLDLNGNKVNNIVANGFVVIMDSSLGNSSVGTVTGNARVMGGKFEQSDIDSYLASGYEVKADGQVINKLYSIENTGDELNIMLHINKDNMAEFIGIEGAVKLAMEVISDVAFNYYRGASLYFTIDGEKCMLYDYSLDNVLGLTAATNRTNVLSTIIDYMIGDEGKGVPGLINEPQFAKIVNEFVDQLTDYQNMDITGETPFFSIDASGGRLCRWLSGLQHWLRRRGQQEGQLLPGYRRKRS